MSARDERTPLVVGSAATAGPDDHVLWLGGARTPADGPHRFGCACCRPRLALAAELSRLYIARARGDLRFARVLVTGPDAAAAVRRTMQEDAFAQARFRVMPP